MVRIWMQMLRIAFEWHSKASNPFQMVRIWIQILRIPLEWLEFVFKCPFESLEFAFEFFQSLSNALNLHSNVLNPFRMV